MFKQKKRAIYLLLVLIITTLSTGVYAQQITTTSQADFNEGNFTNMFYNATGDWLQVNGTTAIYTSKIYPVSSISTWNNISFITGASYGVRPAYNSENEQNVTGPLDMSSTLLYYTFEESSGIIYDHSGNGYNATPFGPAQGVSGKIDRGLSFDGVNDYVAIQDLNFNSAGAVPALSICAWFKTGFSGSAYTDNWGFIDFDRSEYFNFYISSPTGALEFSSTSQAGGTQDVLASTPANDDEWHLGCAVYNRSATNDVQIYLDGTLDHEEDAHPTNEAIGTGTKRYGYLGDGSESSSFNSKRNNFYYDGELDEVIVWNKTLSPKDIQTLYLRTAPKFTINVRSCDDNVCDGENWQQTVTNSPTNLSLLDNNYIQYLANISITDYSTPLYIQNISLDYTSLLQIKSVRAYYQNVTLASYFLANDTVRIKTNATLAPSISITNPDGTEVATNQQMTNETPGSGTDAIYYFDVQNTSQVGWYNVSFGNLEYPSSFYIADQWQDNTTDAQGNIFPFSMQVNVSEQNNFDRWNSLITLPINFSYNAHPNATRVVFRRGSTLLEMPFALYNKSIVNNFVKNATAAILFSTNANQNATLYVKYSPTNYTFPDYSAKVSQSTSSSLTTIQNGWYAVNLSSSYGGTMRDALVKRGTGQNLGGTSPFQVGPEVSDGFTFFRANQVTSPTIITTQQDIRSTYTSSGTVGLGFSYEINYTFLFNRPDILVETTIVPTSAGTWSHYQDQRPIIENNIMSQLLYYNNSELNQQVINDGSGTDYTNIANVDYAAFTNNVTGDAIGYLFLNRTATRSYTPLVSTYDDSSYDYLQRQLYSGAVTSSDSFYSKVSVMLWDNFDNGILLNETYADLTNPLSTVIGQSLTTDDQNPQYTLINYTPQSPQDTQNVTCYSYWTDNIQLASATLQINSSGYNNVTTQALTSNESYVNLTIPSYLLGAGEVTCLITVEDAAGLTNSTQVSFNVSDTAAPVFSSVIVSPNATTDLDPGVTVTISATLIEYSGVDTVQLEYKNASANVWINSSMQNITALGINATYRANLTFSTNDTWSYRVHANDTFGLHRNTSVQTLVVDYDSTWTRSPSIFNASSGTLNENITVGTILLNNTGDLSITYTLSSNWDDSSKIYYNGTAETNSGYAVTVPSLQTIAIPVNITTKSVEREDDVIITITAENASASPSTQTVNFTVVSYASGPFLLVSIDQYNSTIVVGESMTIRTVIQNKGNETASDVNVTIALPTGWSITSGSSVVYLDDIVVDQIISTQMTVLVGTSASTGTQTIVATAQSTEGKTGTDSVNTVVTSSGESSGSSQTSSGGGGGSGGGSSGSSSTNSLSEDELQKLFQTSETYEIIRGQKLQFPLVVENPLDGDFQNVEVSLVGFLSQYLTLEGTQQVTIPRGETERYNVIITVPDYFSKNNYQLKFKITGTVVDQQLINNITRTTRTAIEETRTINLYIYELDPNVANESLKQAESAIAFIERNSRPSQRLQLLLDDAHRLYANKDYLGSHQLATQIINQQQYFADSVQIIREMEGRISQSEYSGINVHQTKRLISLAKVALEREDYETALSRSEDSIITYSLETAGAFNFFVYLKNNFFLLAALILAISVVVYLVYSIIKYITLVNKLSLLNKEKRILMDLTKELQRECFEKNTLSMSQYQESHKQYQDKISAVIQESIKYDTLKKYFFQPFMGKLKKLKVEHNRLQELMKQTQELYLDSKGLETSNYTLSMKRYTERLSKIEQGIAEIEMHSHLKSRGAQL